MQGIICRYVSGPASERRESWCGCKMLADLHALQGSRAASEPETVSRCRAQVKTCRSWAVCCDDGAALPDVRCLRLEGGRRG